MTVSSFLTLFVLNLPGPSADLIGPNRLGTFLQPAASRFALS